MYLDSFLTPKKRELNVGYIKHFALCRNYSFHAGGQILFCCIPCGSWNYPEINRYYT